MSKFFGTDGVRGVANLELTPQLAFDLGRYGAYVLTSHNKHKARILVGKDTRISGDMLECALVAGILSVGAYVELAGVVPTPAIAHLTKKYSADAGVVISASHNSVEYNGIKFFNQDGFKLSDEIELEIEDYILGNKTITDYPTGKDLGRVGVLSNAADDYINFAVGAEKISLDGMKIVLDCANGANSKIAPEAFSRLGCELHVICNEPDGTDINDGCGSTHIENLCNYIKNFGGDLGFAFDGDADRVIAVDEQGNPMDGDVLIGLYAIHLKRLGKLKNNLVIGTEMSNLGLTHSCKKHGIDVIHTRVGDRYVLEKMLEVGSVLGGEQSGHVISLLDNTTGDGLTVAVHIASLVKSSGLTASELSKEIMVLPQVLVNVRVPNEAKPLLYTDNEIVALKNEFDKKYENRGRLVLRPSGTEPVVRIMFEGTDVAEMEKDAEKLKNVIEAKFSHTEASVCAE